jgi:hypothetical protein
LIALKRPLGEDVQQHIRIFASLFWSHS